MALYTVEWVIQLDADSPQEAARKARNIQLNKDSTANYFTVLNTETAVKVGVDQMEREEPLDYDNGGHMVTSSHGTLSIDAEGLVTACDSDNTEDGQHLRSIERFDLSEHKNYWGKKAAGHIDILDLGYWYKNRDGILAYCEPEMDWRDVLKQGLLKTTLEGADCHVA